jgi:RNase adaptor protein for sRNA GlmZ degradation
MSTVFQFGFQRWPHAHALPALWVVDCRTIENPKRKRENKTDEQLKQMVRENPLFEGLVQQGMRVLEQNTEVWVGCAWGKHRSGAVAEEIVRRTGADLVVVMEDQNVQGST